LLTGTATVLFCSTNLKIKMIGKNNRRNNAALIEKDKGKVTFSEWLSLVSITSYY
jgi:hypothetical protein